MNTQLEIENLKRQVAELMEWKAARERQQIVFPLDTQSIAILQRYFLRVVATFVQVGGVALRAFTYFRVQQDQYVSSISQDLSQEFTAATSDTLTLTQYPFVNTDRVYVTTSDTLPAPLDTTTTYYVVSASGLTCKLSLTSGGAAIDITTTGTGTHYINYL